MDAACLARRILTVDNDDGDIFRFEPRSAASITSTCPPNYYLCPDLRHRRSELPHSGVTQFGKSASKGSFTGGPDSYAAARRAKSLLVASGHPLHFHKRTAFVGNAGRHIPQRRCRVEEGRGGLGRLASPRFPSPLIEPAVRISRIRLSDWLHLKAHGRPPR